LRAILSKTRVPRLLPNTIAQKGDLCPLPLLNADISSGNLGSLDFTFGSKSHYNRSYIVKMIPQVN
jgi:hypothetical protein